MGAFPEKENIPGLNPINAHVASSGGHCEVGIGIAPAVSKCIIDIASRKKVHGCAVSGSHIAVGVDGIANAK